MLLRVLVAGLLLAMPSIVLADKRSYSVKPGQSIIITQPHRYEVDCKLIPAAIKLKSRPKMGSVVVRSASYKLGDYGGGNQKFSQSGSDPCLGKNAVGPQVLYKAGLKKGVDRFNLRADFGSRRVFTVNFVIEVK